MRLVLILTALLALPAAADDLADYRDRATQRLLDGQSLPPDYRFELMRMPPARRFEAIVFLRRSGLLTGPGWTAEDLLKPAQAGESDGAIVQD